MPRLLAYPLVVSIKWRGIKVVVSRAGKETGGKGVLSSEETYKLTLADVSVRGMPDELGLYVRLRGGVVMAQGKVLGR